MDSLLVRLPDVLTQTGYKRSSLYKAIADGDFPPPRRLGKRAVAWHTDDIEAWADALPIAEHYKDVTIEPK